MSVQEHLQHQSLCPLSLALRFQKSFITLQLHHNFTRSPQNNSLIDKDLCDIHISSVMLILKILGGLSACWMCKSHWVFVLVQRGLQVKFGHGHTSSGNFQTGWDWLNYEFRTGWKRCFLLVMGYTPFKAHSHVLLSCSQTLLKNSWSGKWHSKPGWMTSFKGPLKTLLHVTNSQQDKIAETFFKSFLFPLFITRNTFFLAIHPLESHRKEKSSSFGCSGDRRLSQQVPAWFQSLKKLF